MKSGLIKPKYLGTPESML